MHDHLPNKRGFFFVTPFTNKDKFSIKITNQTSFYMIVIKLTSIPLSRLDTSSIFWGYTIGCLAPKRLDQNVHYQETESFFATVPKSCSFLEVKAPAIRRLC